jgi:hypothetical protein
MRSVIGTPWQRSRSVSKKASETSSKWVVEAHKLPQSLKTGSPIKCFASRERATERAKNRPFWPAIAGVFAAFPLPKNLDSRHLFLKKSCIGYAIALVHGIEHGIEHSIEHNVWRLLQHGGNT